MIKCHLSQIMGARRLKIADVVQNTGINRGTITRMYHEKAERVELQVVEKLCDYLDVEVGDLYQKIEDVD